MRSTFWGRVLIRILILPAAGWVASGQQTSDSGAKSAAPVPASSDPADFAKQSKVAVVVGQSDYDMALGFHPLRFAGNDAEELAGVLREAGYTIVGDCPPNTPPPTKGGGCALTGPLANRSKVKLALQHAVQVVNDGKGTLLFYFSGHGEQKGPTGEQYMVMYGGDESELQSTSYSVTELNKIMEGTTARKILLIDACRSGEADVSEKKDKNGESTVFRDMAVATGTRVMNSTRHPFSSWEDKDLGHGRFSFYLIKGLKGEALREDGLITFQSLFSYVKHGVDEEVAKHPGQPQQVHQSGDFDNDFILAGTAKPVSAAAAVVSTNRPRRAMLIGNDAYRKFALQGAVNDARAMNAALRQRGFISTLVENATGQAAEAAITQFAQSVQPGDDVLFYFAGNGVLADGQPFLTPVDYDSAVEATAVHRGITIVNVATPAKRSEADAERLFGFPLKKLLSLLALKTDVRKLLIFDICLNPPDSREKPQFLIPPVADGMTAMLFGASPGEEAYEAPTADGMHGSFTKAMLTVLKSGSKLTWPEFTAQVWDLTRKDGGRQTPFPFGYLRTEFRFAGQ